MQRDHELLSHSQGTVGDVGFVGNTEHIALISAGICAVADRCGPCVDEVLSRIAASEEMMMTLINMRVYVEQGRHAFMGLAADPISIKASFAGQDFEQRRRKAWSEIMRLCQSGLDRVDAEQQGR